MSAAPDPIDALRPFAVAGFCCRPDGAFGEVPDDQVVGRLAGVAITARDCRKAYAAVSYRLDVMPARSPSRLRAWLRRAFPFALTLVRS